MKKLLAALLVAAPSFAMADGSIQLGFNRDIDAKSDGTATTLIANYKRNDCNINAHIEAYKIESDFDQYTVAGGYFRKSGELAYAVSIGARSVEIFDNEETEAIVKLDTQYNVLYAEIVAGDGILDTRYGVRVHHSGGIAVDFGWRRNKADTDELKFDVTGAELAIGYAF